MHTADIDISRIFTRTPGTKFCVLHWEGDHDKHSFPSCEGCWVCYYSSHNNSTDFAYITVGKVFKNLLDILFLSTGSLLVTTAVCLSIYLSVNMSVCVYVCLSRCLSVYQDVWLSVNMSVCVYMSVILYIFRSIGSFCLSVSYTPVCVFASLE